MVMAEPESSCKDLQSGLSVMHRSCASKLVLRHKGRSHLPESSSPSTFTRRPWRESAVLTSTNVEVIGGSEGDWWLWRTEEVTGGWGGLRRWLVPVEDWGGDWFLWRTEEMTGSCGGLGRWLVPVEDWGGDWFLWRTEEVTGSCGGLGRWLVAGEDWGGDWWLGRTGEVTGGCEGGDWRLWRWLEAVKVIGGCGGTNSKSHWLPGLPLLCRAQVLTCWDGTFWRSIRSKIHPPLLERGQRLVAWGGG